MGSVNLYSIDVPYSSFDIEGVKFDQPKLDYENVDKQKMKQRQ